MAVEIQQPNNRQVAPQLVPKNFAPAARRYVSPVPGQRDVQAQHLSQQVSAPEFQRPLQERPRHVSPGSNPPSAHALSALRAALDRPVQAERSPLPNHSRFSFEPHRHDQKHQHVYHHQQQQSQSEPQSQPLPQHAPWPRPVEQNSYFEPSKESTQSMRASLGAPPPPMSLAEDIPLRYTMGGSQPRPADFQNASPRALRSVAPLSIRTNAEVWTEARRSAAEMDDSPLLYPAEGRGMTVPQMAAAPHSTKTLAHAQPPPVHAGAQNMVDTGPLGIVFAHTSTPTAQGGGFTFNMHKITEIIPGTAAARCGLKADDTLIRLNDQLVDSMSESDLRYYFGQLSGARSMNIEVLRTRPSAENPDSTQTELERLVLTRVISQDSASDLYSATSPLRVPFATSPAQEGSDAPHSSPQMGANASPSPSTDAAPRVATHSLAPLKISHQHVDDLPGGLQDARSGRGVGEHAHKHFGGDVPRALGGRTCSADLPDPIIQEYREGIRRSPVSRSRTDVSVGIFGILHLTCVVSLAFAHVPIAIVALRTVHPICSVLANK